jgi:hypothetical protein
MARNSRFQRRPPSRHGKPMVLVATEGKETEPIYFDELKTRFREVVTVLVSAGKTGQSNPQRVLKRLREEIAKRASWSKRDQAWLIVDTDQWSASECKEIEAAIAGDSRLYLATSNPCFELWLLLHFRDAWEAVTSDDLDRLLNSSACFGIYEKEDYDASSLMERIEGAISRAKTADTSPPDKWSAPGETQVYRVVKKIMKP